MMCRGFAHEALCNVVRATSAYLLYLAREETRKSYPVREQIRPVIADRKCRFAVIARGRR